jgi:hypothetical protein
MENRQPLYELKINAYAPGELAAAIHGLVRALPLVEKVGMDQAIRVSEESSVKEEKQEKKKKKEKVETPVEETPVEETAVTESPVLETKIVTKDEVATALQKVVEEKSLAKAKEILTKYGTKNISGIKEADYAQFVSDCEEARK